MHRDPAKAVGKEPPIGRARVEHLATKNGRRRIVSLNKSVNLTKHTNPRSLNQADEGRVANEALKVVAHNTFCQEDVPNSKANLQSLREVGRTVPDLPSISHHNNAQPHA